MASGARTGAGLLTLLSACTSTEAVDRVATRHPNERQVAAADEEPQDSGARRRRDAGSRAPTPVAASDEATCSADRVFVGKSHACAISLDQRVHCWGGNTYRQVGTQHTDGRCVDPTEPCEPTPVRVEGIDGVVDMALTDTASCALREDGTVWCWGSSLTLELGATHAECDYYNSPGYIGCTGTPTLMDSWPLASDIDGWGLLTVLARDGTVRAGFGLLETVVGLRHGVAIDHSCALDDAGVVWCWDGTQEAEPWNWDGTAVALSVGYSQVCTISTADELYCWGLDIITNSGGNDCLGCTPELVPLPDTVAQVTGSTEITWVRSVAGAVWMIDTTKTVHEPLQLPEPVVDIASGYSGACAVGESHDVYCWRNPTETLSDIAQGWHEQYLGIELTDEPRLVDLCPELD